MSHDDLHLMSPPLTLQHQPSPIITYISPARPTEFCVNIEIELKTQFTVSTQWRNVVEIIRKQSMFGLTPRLVDQMRSHPRMQIRLAEDDNPAENQLVEEFWKVLHVKQRHYVVFEVESAHESRSFQWLNRDTKLPSSDDVVYTTLCEMLNNVRSVPSTQRPESFRTKCVRCSAPKELRSLVDYVFLLWVSEMKG